MSFTIICNKCNQVAADIKERRAGYPQANDIFTDEHNTIKVESEAGWDGDSSIIITCKCGNEM